MKNKSCPHCNQLMNVYRRNIRKNMLPGLMALSDRTPKKTSELGLTRGARSDFTTLRYWGLIYKPKEQSSDWALTEKGHKFIAGGLSVPRYLFIFNSQVEGRSEEKVFIEQIEKDEFSKKELMDHAAPKCEFSAEEID